jgi:hypothetical protein
MQAKVLLLFLIALIIQTIVYFGAVNQSIEGYDAWTKADQEFINQMISEHLPPDEMHVVFISYSPYFLSFQGKLAVSFGVTLAASWIILLVAGLLSNGNGKKITQTQQEAGTTKPLHTSSSA